MLYRRIIKSIDDSIAIGVNSDGRCLVASGWLRFDRIGNAIVIAVEVKVILNAIAIRIHWRGAQLIPGSIIVVVCESCCVCFSNRDGAIHVGVGVNRNLVAAFQQIADAVVVAVEVAAVMDSVAVGVPFDDKLLSISENEHLAVGPIVSVTFQCHNQARDSTTHWRDVVQWIQRDLNILTGDVGNVSRINVVRNFQIDHAQRSAESIKSLYLNGVVSKALSDCKKPARVTDDGGVVEQCV